MAERCRPLADPARCISVTHGKGRNNCQNLLHFQWAHNQDECKHLSRQTGQVPSLVLPWVPQWDTSTAASWSVSFLVLWRTSRGLPLHLKAMFLPSAIADNLISIFDIANSAAEALTLGSKLGDDILG